MGMDATKDFFISYTRTDQDWAEWIAWQLEKEGYTTILQEWDFPPGSNFVFKMNKAIKQAKQTIAVLSQDYLNSPFAFSEWAAAFRRDPKGEQGLLVPVRVRSCIVEGLLGSIVYIDLVDRDEQAAQDMLLAKVKQERYKPTSAPPFPSVARARPKRPSFPGALPPSRNIPYLSDPYFAGREEELLPSLKDESLATQRRRVRSSQISTIPMVPRSRNRSQNRSGTSSQQRVVLPSQSTRIVGSPRLAKLSPLAEHRHWLLWFICIICGVLFLSVLLSAAINLRPQGPELPSLSGTYSIQVGGNLANSWQQDQPTASKNPTSPQTGPYSVLSTPSISVDFINQVLTAYHSPAAGKGQVLYDLGVKYGIDPVFALAFFKHESSFGTEGEAVNSLSLGNMHCMPNFRCQDNFAWFDSWEDGFKAWYELIRNLYVTQWDLTTVDQIIPKYEPSADHNNETAIVAIKHAVDIWRANVTVIS